jgi:hypothetical protein
MLLNNNFKFKQDPFGLVDFNQGIPFLPSKPPKSGLGWVWWILIILIFGGIIYLGSVIYNHVKDDKDDSLKEPDIVPEINDLENEEKKVEKHIQKLLPEHKVEMRLPLADKANWDFEYIEAKKAEGKAEFVKGYGWLIYA